MIIPLCIALLALNANAGTAVDSMSAERKDGPNVRSIIAMIPQEIREKIPADVRTDLRSLNAQDILALRKIIQQLPKFTSLNQIRQAVRERSPRLEAVIQKRLVKLMAMIALKRGQLIPESVAVAKEARNLTRNYALSIVRLVQKQSPEVKTNLETTFPEFSAFFNSPLFAKLIEHLENAKA